MKKIIILLVVLSAVAVTIAIGYFKQSDPKEHDNAEYVNYNNDEVQVVYEEQNNLDKKLYVSKNYKISFNYPKDWNIKFTEEVNSDVIVSYSEKSVYLNINTLEGEDMDIETMVLKEVYQKGQPYGENPHIYSGRINGLQGMFTIPSSDQNKSFKNQSVCIIKLPKPVAIDGKDRRFLRVHSTKDDVAEIAKSIRQIN